MTNEQTANIVVDFDNDPICIGCGDYQSYCDSMECFAVVTAHGDGDHSRCDFLACGEAGR